MTLKAAVIGLGPHGCRLIDIISKIPQLSLHAVVDRSENVLGELDLSQEVKRYQSIDALWDNGHVDLVCVATNGPSHTDLAIAAMAHGAKYVLVEKPMACSIDECMQMTSKARELGVRLAVDHPRHFCNDYIWLRDKIKSGLWGEPRAIWVQRPGIGLGCLATHSFDLVRFLSGLEVSRVTGWVDETVKNNPRGAEFVDPGGLVILEMGEGVRAVVNQIEDGAGPMSVEIDLTAARVRYDEKFGILEVLERDLSVVHRPNQPPVFKKAILPEGLPVKRNLKAEIKKLIEELISEQPISATGEHGLASIEILIAAYLSQKKGNVPISLPLTSANDRKFWVPVT